MKEKYLTINQIAKLCGITVRTLHYYDEIGLLNPSIIAPNGYRLYDDNSLVKLQEILFFKELDIPLKEIMLIMKNPSYSRKEALEKQKQLLMMKKNRLDKIIKLLDGNLKDEKISLEDFDMTQIKQNIQNYAEEAKQRWGHTDAFKQSSKRTSKYTDSDWKKINNERDAIFNDFADCMNKVDGCKKADDLVVEWQNHITKYFYDCTDEILLGLAEMYKYDERFKENMDKHGEGVTEFISKSIKEYCRKK